RRTSRRGTRRGRAAGGAARGSAGISASGGEFTTEDTEVHSSLLWCTSVSRAARSHPNDARPADGLGAVEHVDTVPPLRLDRVAGARERLGLGGDDLGRDGPLGAGRGV